MHIIGRGKGEGKESQGRILEKGGENSRKGNLQNKLKRRWEHIRKEGGGRFEGSLSQRRKNGN